MPRSSNKISINTQTSISHTVGPTESVAHPKPPATMHTHTYITKRSFTYQSTYSLIALPQNELTLAAFGRNLPIPGLRTWIPLPSKHHNSRLPIAAIRSPNRRSPKPPIPAPRSPNRSHPKPPITGLRSPNRRSTPNTPIADLRSPNRTSPKPPIPALPSTNCRSPKSPNHSSPTQQGPTQGCMARYRSKS